MEENKNEKRKISLAAYVVTLLIMLAIIVLLVCVMIKKEKGKSTENVGQSNASITDKEQSKTENDVTDKYEQYEGRWILKDGEMYNGTIPEEELKISNINENNASFTYDVYRTASLSVKNAKINNNIIVVDNLKEDEEDKESIDISLQLNENEIILDIKNSSIENVKNGKKTFIRFDTEYIEDAEQKALDYYKQALDIRLNYMSMIKAGKEEKDGYTIVENYDEFDKKLDEIFTEKGKNIFIDNWLGLLKRENGKLYIGAGDNPLAETYSSHRISESSSPIVENDMISYKIELTTKNEFGDEDIIENRIEKITLKKVNNVWLIDNLEDETP